MCSSSLEVRGPRLARRALGLDRGDEVLLTALHGGYGFASCVEASGALLTDFHTAQTSPGGSGRREALLESTDELSIPRDGLKTILSYRTTARTLSPSPASGLSRPPGGRSSFWPLRFVARSTLLSRPAIVSAGTPLCPPNLRSGVADGGATRGDVSG